MNLLVIDWDYFFPTPGDDPAYDWGHSETSALHFDAIWSARAADLLTAGPLPVTTGQEHTFWTRFTLARTAKVYIADSNVHALSTDVMRGVRNVWLYDAHHDSGYRGHADLQFIRDKATVASFTCENWMIAYWLRRARLRVRYPTWRSWAMDLEPKPVIVVERAFDDGQPVREMFHRVFICRSPAWVPPWLDADFETFVQRSKRRVVTLAPLFSRVWNTARQAQVEALAENLRELRAAHPQSHRKESPHA